MVELTRRSLVAVGGGLLTMTTTAAQAQTSPGATSARTTSGHATSVQAASAAAQATPSAQAWDFSFPDIDGGTLDFAAFRGKALLVVNTASFCGYTYQYEALEKLHQARAAEGLVVVGVPSGDFNQESADNKTVKEFCDTRFGISFPLAALSHVRGSEAAPFYAWVKQTRGWAPTWNFNKVLVARDGMVTGTFGAGEEPDGTTLSQAISAALGKATQPA